MKKKDIFYAILFFTFAFVLSFGVGELALRFISSQIMIYNIEMLKYGSELKLRDPMSEVSHIHKPNSSAHLMGVDINLNSLGNRSRELSRIKPADEKRIYVAGSSVTMGWGVPENQIFTRLVEEKLNQNAKNHYSFINAGVGNYGTFSSIKIFYRQFEKTKPDMVILHYFIADVEPRDTHRDNSFLQKSYLASYLYGDIQGLIFKYKYKNLFNYYNLLYKDDSPAWQETQSDIKKLKSFLDLKKIPFLIMIVPDFHNLAPGTPYSGLYEKMQQAFTKMGISTLNAFPEFQRIYGTKECLLWVQTNDPHPNSTGHALMAQILYEYLAKHPL